MKRRESGRMSNKTRAMLRYIWISILISTDHLILNPIITAHAFSIQSSGITRTFKTWSWKLHSSTYEEESSTATSSQQPLPPAITIDSLTCSHDGGSTYQLNDVSYILPRGGKVGLVGRNGCGKSTFLKILAEATRSSHPSSTTSTSASSTTTSNAAWDNSIAYKGSIERASDCRVAFVEQDPPAPDTITVADALLGITTTTSSTTLSSTSTSKQDVYTVVQTYQTASLQAETNPEAFASAAAAMDDLNGWDVLTRSDEVATRLGVYHLLQRTLDTLSGGERKRVALAAALVKEPHVLLLDEPTNHLDLAAIRWLSDLIKDQRKMTLLTVTHDRAFLDEVCNTILELDRGSLHSHAGNYASFLESKSARLALEDAAVQSAKARYRVELDWMRRQPQARETKQKARIDAFHKLEKAVRPRPRDAALDLMDGSTTGSASNSGQRRMGNNVLKLKNVSLTFDMEQTNINNDGHDHDDGETQTKQTKKESRIMLDDFSYNFNRGDKIGIVGANGVGKSTFIKVLTGQQPIDSGTIETGETVVFGTYDQMGIEIDQDQRVLDFVKERVEARDGSSMAEAPQEAMKLLKRFQFERQRWNERVSMLSGGERRRLQLLSVLTKRPNFLVLDEPTNDIDLDTLAALESYLDEFNGVLVVVSHDRFFTDKVTNHLFVFEGNGIIKDYMGSLSDYAECLVEQESATSNSYTLGADASNVDPSENKQSNYKEDKKVRMERQNALKKMRREMDRLEPAIEGLKSKSAVIQGKIDGSTDEGWTVLAEYTDEMNKINEEIDEKEMRWLELAELIEEAELQME